MARILITGGAGYIGSHVCVSLMDAGHDVVIIDNFANSSPIAIDRVEDITGKRPYLIEADLADAAQMPQILHELTSQQIEGAIHMAGLKAVGESVAKPSYYYDVNLNTSMNLVRMLTDLEVKCVVFSSSATVYGDLNANPVNEHGNTGPINPYGRCKYFIEHMLNDQYVSDETWQVINLRYFNPVGAHVSGKIGEDPSDIPNNLFPFIAQTAIGRRDQLQIWGNDYDTIDGTGVRDYIHVMDLADGHKAAIEYMLRQENGLCETINLGAGKGYSVLEAVQAFGRASNKQIDYAIKDRRAGDIAEIYADATKAKEMLGWQTRYDLDEMCRDHWRWQSQNPNGYED